MDLGGEAAGRIVGRYRRFNNAEKPERRGMKRMGLIVGVLVLGGIGAGFVALRAWPMINMVETGRTPEYPDVQPRTYQRPMGEVFDAAMHAVSRLSRWTLVGYYETHGEIRVEARSRL